MGALVVPPTSLRFVNPIDYGATFDGIRLFDCSVPSHGNTVSSSSYTFTQADVNKVCTLSPAINVFSGIPIAIPVYTGTIISVSGGVATLGGNQSGNIISGTGCFAFGTDDTAALQRAINACTPLAPSAKPIQGNTVMLPKGIAMITAGLEIFTEVSIMGQGMNASCIKWVSTHSMATAGYEAAIYGLVGNSTTRLYTNNTFSDFEIDMDAAQVNSGYGYQAKAIEIIYMVNPTFRNLYVHGSPATAVGTDFLSGGLFTNNIIVNAGHLKPTTASTGGGCGFSWETGQGFPTNTGYETTVITDNIFFNCHNSAIEPEGDLTNPSNARSVISNNIIITTQVFGNGIRDKGMTGTVITGNVCVCTATQTSGIGIGAAYGGIRGLIENNYIQGFYNGITIEDTATTSSHGYSIRGNTIKSSVINGIQVLQDSPNTLNTMNITDNFVDSSGAAGIAFVNAGTPGTIAHLTLSNNTCSNNGLTTAVDAQKAGIYFADNVTSLQMQGNKCFDNNTGTQKYGVSVATGATLSDVLVQNNHFKGNATSGMSILGTVVGWISDNYGFNPLGIASVAPGSSPWTYTAGYTPEVLYLSGGTVSLVVKNGFTLATGLSATIPLPVMLDPGESVTITYSVAPTALTDKK